MQDRILFIGFLQSSDKFDDMEHPKNGYESFDELYMICDSKGYIANVSEGLNFEIGLNSKFFEYSSHSFQN